MAIIYPVGGGISGILNRNNSFNNGNFSLWYNKFTPVKNREGQDTKDIFKACDNRGKTSGAAVSYYKQFYSQINQTTINTLLAKKHEEQQALCQSFASKYKTIKIKAILTSPMVVGLGESHPSETSMIFDRNIGVPYIPASSLKGLVRFTHIFEIITTNIERLTDRKKVNLSEFEEEYKDFVDIFGGDLTEKKKYRGKVIFLDAYPLKKPELEEDIMNPHYGKYYQEGRAPSDNLTPVPVKFLTVEEDTEFVFRILVPKDLEEIDYKVKTLLENALTEHGIGAKTSIGYGLFQLDNIEEVKTEEEQHMDERATFLEKVKAIKKGNSNEIDSLFRQWQSNETLKNNKDIAKAFQKIVKKKKKNGNFTSHYKIIAEILGLNLE